jgi:hypothetical protein
MRAVLALAAVCLVAAAIGWQQGLFTERTPIYVLADSALGISRGVPVKLFDLTVGRVDGIEIVPGGQVRVRLDIASEYLQHITRDSRAKLMRESAAGESLIEILPGGERAQPVARNGVIGFERGRTLGGMSEDLGRALSPVLSQLVATQRPRQLSAPAAPVVPTDREAAGLDKIIADVAAAASEKRE